jgi:hypothetical protein
MITNEPLDWSSEDVDLWRAFLRTRTGERLFPKFLEAAPSLLGGGGTNEILIRNGEVLGWQGAARTLLSLSVFEPVLSQPEEAYPSPENDAKWPDKQKIEIN